MQIISDLPQDWSEITLSDFIDITELAKQAEDVEDKTAFYLRYCSLFMDEDKLKKLPATEVLQIFNHLWQFTIMPTEGTVPAEAIRVGDKVYKFITNPLDVTKKPFDKMTFEEYEEASAVLNALNKLKDMDNLALLLGIFYREHGEKYNEEQVRTRAEIFKYAVPMSDIWECYFFLSKQIMDSALDTLGYLKKELEKNLD